MAPPPIVTGVSPKEGPPGTRVTIRGEFLGNKPTDLVGLTICGCDCLLSAEWKSTMKIIARSGPGKGRGEIIVTTLSGGKGTSTVQFRGYHETVGPLKESAVWVEEASPLQPWSSITSGFDPYHIDDPLGLSVEANEKKILDEDLSEMFPGGSGDLGSESFEPGWFLLERHQATPFDDLRSGLAFLKRKIHSHKQGHLTFLKGNVGSVMEQLETLESLKTALEKDMNNAGLDRIEKIQNSITEATAEGDSLFEGVLSGREAAERRRSTLSTMQRFRFLFTLPNAIETNIKLEEYDAVISDYSRAINLFGKTEVNLFKKILAEVEIKITDLKVLLQKKLHSLPNTLNFQKKIIRSLVGLSYEGDPGWEAIQVQADYIKAQIIELSPENNFTVSKTGSSKSGNKDKKSIAKDEEAVCKRVEAIEDVVKLILWQLPFLRSLALSYFAGELHIKPDSSKKQLFQGLVSEVVGNCLSRVRSLALAPGLASLGPWLPHALRVLRSLHTLSLPPQAHIPMDKLLIDLRMECVRSSLGNAVEKVKKLGSQEDWQLIHDSHHGTITRLPLLFENLMNECHSSLRESVLHGIRGEPLLLGPGGGSSIKEIESLLQSAADAFTHVLEALASQADDEDEGPSLANISQMSTYSHSNQQMAWEGRVLGCIANWHWLETKWKPEDSWGVGVVVAECGGLISTLIEAKSDPLIGTIEPSMYIGEFEWATADLPPADVRPYVKEIIANLISVHAQLEEVCPWLQERVLTSIVETVGEEMSRLISCISRISPEGAQQATLDILTLLHALEPFTTDIAKSYFLEALESIPKIEQSEKKLVDNLLEKFKVRMSMQLLCLQKSK